MSPGFARWPRAVQGLVALLVACLDALRLDRELGAGLRRVVAVQVRAALELAELPTYLGGHRVPGDEADPRVGGVEVSDLVDAPGELPAVAGALVAVVVDGIVQLRPAIAEAPELADVGTAGCGVAVKLDRARVSSVRVVMGLSLDSIGPVLRGTVRGQRCGLRHPKVHNGGGIFRGRPAGTAGRGRSRCCVQPLGKGGAGEDGAGAGKQGTVLVELAVWVSRVADALDFRRVAAPRGE